ncbi:MAG: hypothetical protein R3B54_04510 [Bdellovibrionota bacterium]
MRRYPNAIYRGSCRSLKMFACDSSNYSLVEARLLGKKVFDDEWQNHGRLSRTEVEGLAEFWDRMEAEDKTFAEAEREFARVPVCRDFRGFEMDEPEARFLFQRIQSASSYLARVSPRKVADFVANDIVDLLAMEQLVQEENRKLLFRSGNHIDIATREFRALYGSIVNHPHHAKSAKLPVSNIGNSIRWLDANWRAFPGIEEWGPVWFPNISGLLSMWLSHVNKDGTPSEQLLDDLRARAEEVVRGRGTGKQAPHEKTTQKRKAEQDSDIREELQVRESSFRLSNGALIFRDVSKAVKT